MKKAAGVGSTVSQLTRQRVVSAWRTPKTQHQLRVMEDAIMKEWVPVLLAKKRSKGKFKKHWCPHFDWHAAGRAYWCGTHGGYWVSKDFKYCPYCGKRRPK